MPNLVGIWDSSADAPNLDATLTRMMNLVDIPAFGYSRTRAHGTWLACGNVLPRIENNLSQPARDDARGLWVMLDGEFMDPEGLEKAVPSHRHRADGRARDDAELALDAYIAHGIDFVRTLNGQWNLLIHDEPNRTTHLVTDRVGSRLVFFARDGERFVFASEAKAVIVGRNRSTRAGGRGLVELMASGVPVGSATWLEGIEVLEPGTIVTLGRGGPTYRRYFRFRFEEGSPRLSDVEYADGLARALATATERCMRTRVPMPIAITLSGGLDSRSVALSIPRHHLPITALTYGDPESADVRFARMLADAIGLEHRYVETERNALTSNSARVLDEIVGPAERGFLSSQVDRIAWRSEGMSCFYGAASMLWHPVYAKLMRVMLNGSVGDALTGSHIVPKMMLNPSRRSLMESCRKSMFWQPREAVEGVLNPTFVAKHWPFLRQSIETLFDGIDAEHAVAIGSVLDMENRQRRGTFSTATIERYFCTCRSPFLDYDFAEFAASIPPRHRFQQHAYKMMIVRTFPGARHVPWAYTEGPITSSAAYEFLRELGLFAKRRVERALPVGRARRKNWMFRDNLRLMQEERVLADFVRDWVASDAFPSDVFNAVGIRALLDRFVRDATERDGVLFAHLCQIARWHLWGLVAGEATTIRPECDPSRFGVVPVPLA